MGDTVPYGEDEEFRLAQEAEDYAERQKNYAQEEVDRLKQEAQESEKGNEKDKK